MIRRSRHVDDSRRRRLVSRLVVAAEMLGLLLFLAQSPHRSKRFAFHPYCSAYRFADYVVVVRDSSYDDDDDDDNEYDNHGGNHHHHHQPARRRGGGPVVASSAGGMTLLADVPPPATATAGCSGTATQQRRPAAAAAATWRETDWILAEHWSEGDGYNLGSPETTTTTGRRRRRSNPFGSPTGPHQGRRRRREGSPPQHPARPDEEDDENDDEDHHRRRALTYGEVTPLGVRQLAHEMGMNACGCTCGNQRDNDDDDGDVHDAMKGGGGGTDGDNGDGDDIIFFDLGSGVGRLVTQIVLDSNSGSNSNSNSSSRSHGSCRIIKRAVGVELSQERHEIAVRALSNIRSNYESHGGYYEYCHHDSTDTAGGGDNFGDDGPRDGDPLPVGAAPAPAAAATTSYDRPPVVSQLLDRIELVHGDVLDVDLGLATHVFVSSLCFPDSTLEGVQTMIHDAAPNVKVVAALNRLDVLSSSPAWSDGRDVPIQMSWGPGLATVYFRHDDGDGNGSSDDDDDGNQHIEG